MKKYIIAGAIGFLIHAAWIAVGIVLVNSWSYLNIYLYHGKNIERNVLAAAFFAMLISALFVIIGRILLFRIKYPGKEKWLLSLVFGLGFYLAFWALIGLFQLTFSGFGF